MTCPSCHSGIAVAQSYNRLVFLLTLCVIVLLATATHTPESGGTWLFFNVLVALPVWVLFVRSVPPWLQPGSCQPKVTLVVAWLGAAFTIFLVEFLGYGSAFVLLGASRRELNEHLEMLSYPLAWLSPNFLLTHEQSFLGLCGVILGNSMFFGLLLFACYKPVRAAFIRNRPTRLSISGAENPTDEKE